MPANLENLTMAIGLEKEMATHSSVLAWRIPGMGEPVGLPPMGLHRVGNDISCKDGLNQGQKWYGPDRSIKY